MSDIPLCRLCAINTETIRHITSGSSKLAQKEYRKKHGKVPIQVHWDISNRYEHKWLPVVKNDGVKVVCDMTKAH